MAFDLVVRFTGLCAFVPNNVERAMRVLLVDAPGMEAMPDMNMPAMEAHIPALVFDTRDVAPGNVRQPDDGFFDGKPKGICWLKGQDLEITPMRPDALEVMNGQVANCPLGARPHSLSWIAQMADHGLGTIDGSCLAPGNVHPKVAARIRLTEGRLVTRDIAQAPERGWVQWKFGPANGQPDGAERAIAEVIELTLPIADDSVTINATSFRNGREPLPPLVLAPQNGNGRVLVTIEDMPFRDIKRLRSPEEEAVLLQQARNRDRHFEHFSRLSQNDPGEGKGPIPTAVAVCERLFDPPILGNPQCPPAGFQADPNA
jgi:hypothetical protein